MDTDVRISRIEDGLLPAATIKGQTPPRMRLTDRMKYYGVPGLALRILKVLRLPPQCTFWRFLASLHVSVARQLLEVQREMRRRVWEAGHVKLESVTLDTDTTVHTVYGKQMGARKSDNPKNKGKKSYQPILTFLAETREYVGGELHNGGRPTGQIAKHLEEVMTAVPESVKMIYGRADSGFYCWQAVQAYEKHRCQFIMVARKTERLLEELKSAHWKQVSTHGRRRKVRILLSTAGLGAQLPIHRAAL